MWKAVGLKEWAGHMFTVCPIYNTLKFKYKNKDAQDLISGPFDCMPVLRKAYLAAELCCDCLTH